MPSIVFDGRASTGFVRSGNEWSNGVDYYKINQTNPANPDAISIVSDPLGVYGSVWKMTLTQALDYDSVTDKTRAELSTPNSGVNAVGPPRDNSNIYMAKGADLWFLWRFMLSPDFHFASRADHNTHDIVILQIHDSPGGIRAAPWHLMLVNEWLELRGSYDETSTGNERLLWRQKASRGLWYSCVLNALWDDAAPAGGYMHWWVNGRKEFFEIDALNTYATLNSPGPYPKCSGLYYPHGTPDEFVANTVYHVGLQVGTEYSSFTEFMAACGSSETELEGFVTRGVSL